MTPASMAGPPPSAMFGCAPRSRITASPRRQWTVKAIALHIVPEGKKQRRFLAREIGDQLLQLVDGRVLAALLVADGRLGHEGPHAVRRPRRRVARKIDHPAVLPIYRVETTSECRTGIVAATFTASRCRNARRLTRAAVGGSIHRTSKPSNPTARSLVQGRHTVAVQIAQSPTARAELAEAMLADYRARTPRSAHLAEAARRVMPGGDTRTVAFHAPYPLTVERGAGVPVRRRRRQRVPRSAQQLHLAHPRPRPPGHRRRRHGATPEGHQLRHGGRVANAPGRDPHRAGRLGRSGPLHQLRHRSDDERGPRRPRLHRPRSDRQDGGRLPRHLRRLRGQRPSRPRARRRRGHARRPVLDTRGVPRQHRRQRPRRPLQRRRRPPSASSPSAATRSPPSSSNR